MQIAAPRTLAAVAPGAIFIVMAIVLIVEDHEAHLTAVLKGLLLQLLAVALGALLMRTCRRVARRLITLAAAIALVWLLFNASHDVAFAVAGFASGAVSLQLMGERDSHWFAANSSAFLWAAALGTIAIWIAISN